MKKILLKFALALAFIGAMLITCCEEPPPPRPDCEVNDYGSVTVKNSTGLNIWVDVTWGSISENYEKLLYNGNSYKYTKVPSGGIEVWITLDGSDWRYKNESLSACENMTFTWYLDRKKSNECPFVLDIGNGELVKPIRKTKH